MDGKQVPDVYAAVFAKLSFWELNGISESNPVFAMELQRYLKSGKHLLIDEESLQKCPVEDQVPAFKQLSGQATALTLNGISDSAAQSILENFQSVKSLIISAMTISEQAKFPTTLTRLELVHCKMHQKVLDTWLSAMRITLESLHLVDVKCYDGPLDAPLNKDLFTPQNLFSGGLASLKELTIDGFNFHFLYSALLPVLETLTVHVDTLQMDKLCSGDITRLHVKAKKCSAFNAEFPLLTHLSFDVPCSKAQMDKILTILKCTATLKELTLNDGPSDVKSLTRFKNLAYLKIINPLGEKFPTAELEHIKFLDLKHGQAGHQAQTQQQPQKAKGKGKGKAKKAQNKIPSNSLLILNDSCLKHLFGFLTVQGWMSLVKAHPRFEELLKPCMEEFYFKGNPVIDSRTEFLSKYVTRMRAAHIDETQPLLKFLALFKNLKTLRMFDIRSFKDTTPVDRFPAGLQELIMEDQYNFPDGFLTKLFKRLNPSLTKLYMDLLLNTQPLLQLHNIKDIFVCAFGEDNNLLAFLLQNKCLEKVNLRINSEMYSIAFWEVLAGLKKLKTLILQFNRKVVVPLPSKTVARFNHIEDLTIRLYGMEDMIPIFALVGPQLKRLTVHSPLAGPNFVRLFSKRFPKLEELVISGTCKWSADDMKELCSFKTLTTLRMNYKSPNQKKNFVLLIKQLPKLTEIECHGMNVDRKMKTEIDEYLKVTKRPLKLTGFTFDADAPEKTIYLTPACQVIDVRRRYIMEGEEEEDQSPEIEEMMRKIADEYNCEYPLKKYV